MSEMCEYKLLISLQNERFQKAVAKHVQRLEPPTVNEDPKSSVNEYLDDAITYFFRPWLDLKSVLVYQWRNTKLWYVDIYTGLNIII